MRSAEELEARQARVSATVRLGGFAVVCLAFLGVSQSFTGKKQQATTPTTPPRAAVVFADESLRPVLTQVAPRARYTFGTSASLEAQLAGTATADVFLSQDRDAMQALVDAGRCSTPVAFTTKPLTASCLVRGGGANAAIGAAYVDGLTTLTARETLINAGFDVPANR